ncbi:MAG TPA: hypothetical protein VE133_11935 [Candidatus Sulfotelmatobacter sp.]|jgi:hypothetical protein|nr:hypothetical protein [Candidatus Sulfotelmatobacter sp.]
MTRHASLLVCIFLFGMAGMTFAQAGCNFKITGDWELTVPGQSSPNFYRFTPDDIVTAYSVAAKGEKPRKLGAAAYRLEEAQDSKTLEFKPLRGTGFPLGNTRMEITRVDHENFTAVSGGLSTTWTKKDSNRYYVLFAAHRGAPPHQGGPAFAMLIKTGGDKPEVETFGLFYRQSERINGPVAGDLYRRFMADTLPDDDAVLRLQISSQAFEDAMKIMRSWQERAREGTLLFPSYSYLNVVVPLKEIAESLDQCGEGFHLYKLTWMVDDELGANVPQWELAFAYVKRLRQLNEQSNIDNAKFQENIANRQALPLSEN